MYMVGKIMVNNFSAVFAYITVKCIAAEKVRDVGFFILFVGKFCELVITIMIKTVIILMTIMFVGTAQQ